MLPGTWPTFHFGRFLLMCWIGERKMVGTIPLGRPGLSANAIAFFLVLSYWHLTGPSGIAELILYVVNL